MKCNCNFRVYLQLILRYFNEIEYFSVCTCNLILKTVLYNYTLDVMANCHY